MAPLKNQPRGAARGAPRETTATASLPESSWERVLPQTRWSIVRTAAGGGDPARARLALEELTVRYRPAIEAYFEHRGHAAAERDALVEAFIAEWKTQQPGSFASGGPRSFRVWLHAALGEFALARESSVAGAANAEDSEVPGAAPLRSSAAVEHCPRCGAPAGDPNRCEICLVSMLRQVPTRIANYRIVEEMGRGAEATVYRASKFGSDEYVALKIANEEHLQAPDVLDRFRRAAELSSRLDHDNIVKIVDTAGLAEERPFYAMRIVTGGSLAERMDRFRDPVRAAKLMIKVAEAVHHAHQRGVLHRDISPANILLDLDDEPYVADFMATWIGGEGARAVVGNLNYMAPEQAFGLGGTVVADVYGLGAILYELLAGKPPIDVRTPEERREVARDPSLQPLESLARTHRELDAICQAALNQRPAARHPSAAVFADSLKNVLRHEPPVWPEVGKRRRLALWVRRHPVPAAGALLGASLLAVADFAILSTARSQQSALRETVLHGNAALASAQARAVLALFEKYASQTARAAMDPGIREVAERGQVDETPPALQRVFEQSGNFDSVSVFSTDGRILARYPGAGPGYLGRSYEFRRYFTCARAVAQKPVASAALGKPYESDVCISPAYRGEASGGIEFTLTTPIRGENGAFIGLVGMSKHASTTLGEIDFSDTYRSGQTTALFGHRDRDRDSPPPDRAQPPKLTAVAHPSLFNTEEHALDPALTARLIERFGGEGEPGIELRAVRVRPLEETDYLDPVTHDHRLTGFAPVGKTGFVVAVSTPTELALGVNTDFAGSLSEYVGLLNLGFLFIGGVALWASVRAGRFTAPSS